jgi:hypothetical protein
METFIKDSLKMIKKMAKENAFIKMEIVILELGKMTHNMGKVY